MYFGMSDGYVEDLKNFVKKYLLYLETQTLSLKLRFYLFLHISKFTLERKTNVIPNTIIFR